MPTSTQVTMNGGSAYIYLIGNSYVVIDGIHQSDGNSDNSMRVSAASRCAIVNSEWAGTPTGWGTIGRVEAQSTYNLFFNNYGHDAASADANGTGMPFYNTNVSYNMVLCNHFNRGGHDAGLLIGDGGASRYNKWCNNLHDNHWGSGFHAMNGSGSMDHNLFEGFVVSGVRSEGTVSVYKPGIEMDGSYNTIRRGVIMNGAQSDSHGIEINSNSGSAFNNNLFYNNVIYFNQGEGVDFMQTNITSNAFVNNIIYWNGIQQGGTTELYCHNVPTDMNVRNNLILSKKGSTDSPSSMTINFADSSTYTTAQANSRAPGFSGNIASSPGFINATGGDFHPTSTSPMIAAGTTITDPVWGAPPYPGTKPSIGVYEYYSTSGSSSPSSGGAGSDSPAASLNLGIISHLTTFLSSNRLPFPNYLREFKPVQTSSQASHLCSTPNAFP